MWRVYFGRGINKSCNEDDLKVEIGNGHAKPFLFFILPEILRFIDWDSSSNWHNSGEYIHW